MFRRSHLGPLALSRPVDDRRRRRAGAGTHAFRTAHRRPVGSHRARRARRLPVLAGGVDLGQRAPGRPVRRQRRQRPADLGGRVRQRQGAVLDSPAVGQAAGQRDLRSDPQRRHARRLDDRPHWQASDVRRQTRAIARAHRHACLGEPIKLTSRSSWREAKGWTFSDDGGLASTGKAENLVSTQAFNDFTLHVEFRLPKGRNSGVYLRGRYEAQIEDSDAAEPPLNHIGGIYGFLAPTWDARRQPGEWQTFDITLVGRVVTIEFNGRRVICDREIPGITGGAIDSDEGSPGPIMLQGDHGAIEYRNITIRPAQ